jgi:hypothetical protein
VAEHYERVTIAERDELPQAPERRKTSHRGSTPMQLHARGCGGLSRDRQMSFSRKELSKGDGGRVNYLAKIRDIGGRLRFHRPGTER